MLFTKIMPIFKYCICIGFRISEEVHEEINKKLAGIGQGNKFLEDMCRDISCLLIKEIEKKN